MQSIRNTFKSLVTLVSLCLALGVMPGHTDETVFEFESWKDLEIYFAELGYTEEEWNKGQRVVPPLYVTNMPTRWRGSVSKEVDVRTKIETLLVELVITHQLRQPPGPLGVTRD